MCTRSLFLALVGLSQAVPTSHEIGKRVQNGVGVTPAMGFNNWNAGLRTSHSSIGRYSVPSLLIKIIQPPPQLPHSQPPTHF